MAENDGIHIKAGTLRDLLIEAGDWKARRRSDAHRSQRERRECFGELIQFDGSHHKWLKTDARPAACDDDRRRYQCPPCALLPAGDDTGDNDGIFFLDTELRDTTVPVLRQEERLRADPRTDGCRAASGNYRAEEPLRTRLREAGRAGDSGKLRPLVCTRRPKGASSGITASTRTGWSRSCGLPVFRPSPKPTRSLKAITCLK